MSVVEVNIADLSQDPVESSRSHLDPERVDHYVEHLDEATLVTVLDTGDIAAFSDSVEPPSGLM